MDDIALLRSYLSVSTNKKGFLLLVYIDTSTNKQTN